MSDHESSGVLRDRGTRRLPLRGRARPDVGPGDDPDRRRGDQHRGRRHPQPAGRRAGPRAPRRRVPVRRHGGEVGADVRGFAVGDRAVTVGLDGSHAELPGDAGRASPGRSPTASTDEAACVPVPFGTADDCLFEFGHLQAGETVLDPCRRRRGRHRRDPDGQAGRGAGLRHSVERRPARAAEASSAWTRASTTSRTTSSPRPVG